LGDLGPSSELADSVRDSRVSASLLSTVPSLTSLLKNRVYSRVNSSRGYRLINSNESASWLASLIEQDKKVACMRLFPFSLAGKAKRLVEFTSKLKPYTLEWRGGKISTEVFPSILFYEG